MKKHILFFVVILGSVLVCAEPKEIIFIRHGFAQHNELSSHGQWEESRKIRDPHLVPLGVEQSKVVHGELKDQTIDLVVVSPMTRTLQTASYIFENRDIPIVALADLSETCSYETCHGIEKSELQLNFPQVDFSLVDDNWLSVWPETRKQMNARVEHFKEWLQKQNASVIVVVSHGGVIQRLLGGREPYNCQVIKTHFDENGVLITDVK